MNAMNIKKLTPQQLHKITVDLNLIIKFREEGITVKPEYLSIWKMMGHVVIIQELFGGDCLIQINEAEENVEARLLAIFFYEFLPLYYLDHGQHVKIFSQIENNGEQVVVYSMTFPNHSKLKQELN